ncbi:MAG TPA: hypothetical protein VJN62_00500, partial [Gemmatimonadales bacterium]|nr:hypothetical protein [Gemmatimonadales bacterium]
GTYTATIKGTTAGSPASLGGTVNGQAIATTLPSVVVLHGAPGQLTVSAGDNQTAPAGTAVAIQPAVTVADSFGNLIQNDTVFWAVTGGSGVAKGDTTLTSAGGFASLTQWVLGASLGGNMLLASTGTLNHTFHATGSAPVISDSVPLGNSMLGLQPLGVAIDTARNLIYVADSGSNEVTIIDEATLRAIDSVPVGVDPVAVAVNPSLNRIYVADAGDSTLDVIDGSSRTVLSTIPLGASPLNIAIDPATDSIYVAAGPLVVVDPTLNAVAGSVSLSVFAELVAVNGTQHVVYAGAYNWASVAVMSLSNRAPLAPIPVSGAGLAVNPATNRLYVADQDGTVRMFDGASNAQLLSVSSPLKPSRVDVDVAANRVYVSHCFGTVDILDGTTLGTLGTISGRLFASCTSGESPIRFAVDSKLHLVVGTNHGTDLVVIADGGSAAVQAVVPRVTSISGLAVDPSRGRIYAAAAPAGQVLVVDESSHRVIDAQSVATGLGTIAIDVSRNRLYVANGSSVLMVDASTLVPGSPISLTDQVFDLAVNPVTNHAYARRSFATDDIDGGTGGVVGTLTTGGATQGIAVDTLRNLVYIAIDGSPGASIFDGATDAFLKLMTTPGSQGGGAGINPVTNRIFVIDEDSPGRVEDYDGAARALVTGVQVGPFPGRLAVDSKLNVVYVIIGGGIWYVSGGLDAVVVTLSTGTATAITVDPVAGKAFVASGTALVTITP